MPIDIDRLPDVLKVHRSDIVFLHRALLPILSKHDLRTHYGLPDLRALRRKVLTDDVLRLCNITPRQYHAKWSFTAVQSAKLYEVLNIVWLRTNLKA
jgi:hypothetical protein